MINLLNALAIDFECDDNIYAKETCDKAATALEALSAELTTERAAHAETKRERDEAFQKYVDANEARIDAEAQRDEAMKALDALDRMNRGLDWCDQDEQARRWSAARRALEGGE